MLLHLFFIEMTGVPNYIKHLKCFQMISQPAILITLEQPFLLKMKYAVTLLLHLWV